MVLQKNLEKGKVVLSNICELMQKRLCLKFLIPVLGRIIYQSTYFCTCKVELVEAAGIEPASANPLPLDLHV